MPDYKLGSERESQKKVGQTTRWSPAGTLHAIDNDQKPLCGTKTRLIVWEDAWRNHAGSIDAHETCVECAGL